MIDYLVYKTLYYDKETKKALLKEEEFEIKKVGNKWFYLKEFDSNNDIPCQLYINSNYGLTSIQRFVNLTKPSNIRGLKVNKNIFDYIFYNCLNFGNPEITVVYLKSSKEIISTKNLMNLLVSHESNALKERLSILQNIMNTNF